MSACTWAARGDGCAPQSGRRSQHVCPPHPCTQATAVVLARQRGGKSCDAGLERELADLLEQTASRRQAEAGADGGVDAGAWGDAACAAMRHLVQVRTQSLMRARCCSPCRVAAEEALHGTGCHTPI